MQRFIDWKFWLDLAPEALSKQSSIVLLIVFIGLMVAGCAYYFISKKKWAVMVKPQKEVVRMVRTWLVTAGSLGLVWLFFAYEGISLLSARFWLIIGVVVFGVWAYSIGKFALVVVPERLVQIEKSRQFSKYLPKRK